MSTKLKAGTSTSGAVIDADTTGILELQSGSTPTTGLTVNAVQGVSVTNCLAVGNATPSTGGAGITFPATQSNSTDANTLDDYEEGTWVVADVSGAGLSLTSTTGRYIKIGGLVYFAFDVNFPSTANATNIRLSLPFTAGGTTSFSASVGYSNSNSIAQAYISSSTPYVAFYNFAGVAVTNATNSGKELAVSGCYSVI